MLPKGGLLEQAKKTEACIRTASKGLQEAQPALHELRDVINSGIPDIRVGFAGQSGSGKTTLQNSSTFAFLVEGPEYKQHQKKKELDTPFVNSRCVAACAGPPRRLAGRTALKEFPHLSQRAPMSCLRRDNGPVIYVLNETRALVEEAALPAVEGALPRRAPLQLPSLETVLQRQKLQPGRKKLITAANELIMRDHVEEMIGFHDAAVQAKNHGNIKILGSFTNSLTDYVLYNKPLSDLFGAKTGETLHLYTGSQSGFGGIDCLEYSDLSLCPLSQETGRNPQPSSHSVLSPAAWWAMSSTFAPRLISFSTFRRRPTKCCCRSRRMTLRKSFLQMISACTVGGYYS